MHAEALPGPNMPPIVGMLRWLFAPLPMLDDLARRYGDVFATRLPKLDQPFVFFSDPAAVREIWAGDPDVFRAGESNVLLRSILGPNSLLLLDGADHLRERRLMLPPFHGDRMKAYGLAMRDAAQRELATWPRGRAFGVHAGMQAITLDVIMQTIFGVGGNDPKLVPLRDALVTWTELGTSRLGTALFLLTPPDRADAVRRATETTFGRFLPWAPLVRAAAHTDRLVREVIAARRSEPADARAKRTDILTMLVEARDEHGAPMTEDELRDEMLTLLLAGHETTATTLAWALHHLVENPAWLARIEAELAEVVGAGPLQLEHLERLVLLDAAIKETMRLTPIIPIVGRRLKRAATVGGRELPAGATAIAAIYLVHRRPDLWPSPERFDPGRFVGRKIDPTQFFPFGGGTRRCIGMAFASYEMKIVLATVLSSLRVARAPGRRVKLVRRGITLAPSGGMPIVVTAR
jgi:cytochrome P450|nr:cytochrome P450 [Kofleriaceae bacterium]